MLKIRRQTLINIVSSATSYLARSGSAICFLLAQTALFFVTIAIGWSILGRTVGGSVDWVVTSAYGLVIAAAFIPILYKRNREMGCCVGAFFFFGWVVSVLFVAIKPGFIAHAPIVFGAICAMCVYHFKKPLIVFSGLLSIVCLVELLTFGPIIDIDEDAGGFVVVHQFLFLAWLVCATFEIMQKTPSDPISNDRETQARQSLSSRTTAEDRPKKVA